MSQACLIERRSCGQDIRDHAVPAHHVGGIHINDVTRAQGEAVGQQHGVGRRAIQVEELRGFAFAAHHVDPLGVGSVLGDVTGVGQGFGQGRALLGHDHGAGLGDFAQHKDLVEAAVLHVEDVAGLEQGVLLGGAGFVHGLDVDPVGGALAGKQHTTVVGLGRKAAGAVNRFEYGKGDVGDFEQAGLGHFAHHVHALAAEGRHAHIQLHFFDVLGEALGEHVAHLAGGFARYVEGAHVGVEDGAVFIDHGACLVGGAVLAGGGGELGVVPDDDAEDVARADLVVGGSEVVAGAFAAVGGEVVVGGGGARRLGCFELLDDQLGRDGLDGDVVGYGLGRVALLDRQLDGGFLISQGVSPVARHDGTGTERGTEGSQQDAAQMTDGRGGASELCLHGFTDSEEVNDTRNDNGAWFCSAGHRTRLGWIWGARGAGMVE